MMNLLTCLAMLQAPTPVTVPFEFVNNEILVEVHLGDDAYTFLFDTGVTPSAIDLQLARAAGWVKGELGGNAEGVGDGPGAAIYPASLDGLRLGPLSLDGIDAAAADFRPFARKLGHPLHGILGHAFLKSRRVRIDYPARLLHFETPRASLEPEDALWCGPLEFVEGDIMPLLREFEVDGVALQVSVDTGSNGVLQLYPDGARDAHVEPREGAAAEIFGARGAESVQLGMARTIGLGPLVVHDSVIVLSARQRPGNRVGNLGNGFLKHFELELDYVDLHIILRRTEASKPLAHEMEESEVFKRWADALGGRERLAEVRSRYSRRTATVGGVEGTIEVWMTSTGKRRFEQHFGEVVNSVLVFDGERGSETSSGGHAELSKTRVVSSLTHSYVNTWSFLRTDRVAGTARYLGADPADGVHVVECRPRGGHIVRFYLDPVTFLPSASEILVGSGRRRTEYSDWTTIEGIRFPRVRTATGPDGRAVEARLNELRLNQDVDDALYR